MVCNNSAMTVRGAPDPEFCYPAGSGSEPDPTHLDPAGSAKNSASSRIRIQTSTTADNRRKITLSAPQLEETGITVFHCFVTELLLE